MKAERSVLSVLLVSPIALCLGLGTARGHTSSLPHPDHLSSLPYSGHLSSSSVPHIGHLSSSSVPHIGHLSSLAQTGYLSSSPLPHTGHLSSLSSSPLPHTGHLSSLSSSPLPAPLASRPSSEYSIPPCSQHFHAQFPVCSEPRSYQNCTVLLDNMYTIEYKEECGRKYDKICYGPGNTDCKAVVDPGCYSVPTHSPVKVAREICYNLSTGERCDKYPEGYPSHIRCN